MRSRPLHALPLALALGALACTKAKSAPAGIRFRQPSAVAAFSGRTLKDPANVRAYFAVANASRNDVTVLDAVDDTPVPSPIRFRALVLPVEDRPSLLAAASLGDGKADLLVAVSGGDSVLQVVETWHAANAVHAEPPLAVDLGHDVLALAAVPSVPGTARLAAALSGSRVAIVEYARAADGEAIALVSARVSDPLVATGAPAGWPPFQPEAIAAMPGPVLQTALYVATRDELAPGVFGVAEVSLDLATVRALGARAPTRLVAAARLQERKADSAASDETAFKDQPPVQRVYAVLDESGCGTAKPVDCGVVALDPAVAAGAQALPPDYAGLMPYRAPMRLRGRALALAVSGPPARPPPDVAGEPQGGSQGWQALGTAFMRIYLGTTIARATTAVAAVATEDGGVYFLDLGRFERQTSQSILKGTGAGAPSATDVTVTENGQSVQKRLWIVNPADGSFPADVDAAKHVTVTPGFTPDETFAVTYQGPISGDLEARAGEAGTLQVSGKPDQTWLALQHGQDAGGGARTFTEVVRLWDPALGVHAATVDASSQPVPGDILVIKASGVPGCVGTDPPGTKVNTPASEIRREFEVEVGDLLAPTAAYPGGAVSLVPRRATENRPEWSVCADALKTAAAGTNVVTGLSVTVRATGYVIVGKGLGYAGRPEAGRKFTLQYGRDPNAPDPAPNEPPVLVRDEDALAAACPLAAWTGALPAPACDATCRVDCEILVLTRKVRRLHNVSEDCNTDPSDAAACATQQGTAPPRWPPDRYPFPVVNGPALAFTAAVQPRTTGASATPVRDMALTVTTTSGVLPLGARGASTSPFGASGAIAFDRSPVAADPAAGYRFLVSYPADFVLDTTAGLTGPPAIVIR